jgi:hypothetical protein
MPQISCGHLADQAYHVQSGELRCTVIHKEDDYTAFFDFLATGSPRKVACPLFASWLLTSQFLPLPICF